jgi:hypothetical protein
MGVPWSTYGRGIEVLTKSVCSERKKVFNKRVVVLQAERPCRLEAEQRLLAKGD